MFAAGSGNAYYLILGVVALMVILAAVSSDRKR